MGPCHGVDGGFCTVLEFCFATGFDDQPLLSEWENVVGLGEEGT